MGYRITTHKNGCGLKKRGTISSGKEAEFFDPSIEYKSLNKILNAWEQRSVFISVQLQSPISIDQHAWLRKDLANNERSFIREKKCQ